MSANLSHALGGVWRLTWRRFLMPARWGTLLLALAMLALLCLGSEGPRRLYEPRHYLTWVANFYITFLVPAFAFMTAAGAMRDEMKSATLDYVLTRPLPRPAFLGFKFLSHLACVQIDFLIAFGVVAGVGVFRGVTGLGAVVPQMLVCQLLLATAFSALGFLSATLTGRYVVIGLAYGALIEAGVGQIPTQLSRLSMTQQVRDLLAVVLQRVEPHVNSPGFFGTTGILLVFTALMLTAAAAIFTMRELSGAPEA